MSSISTRKRDLGGAVTTAQSRTYGDAPNKVCVPREAVRLRLPDVGSGIVPLVLLSASAATFDNWVPALIDALASHSPVRRVDNVESRNNRTTPNAVERSPRCHPFSDAMNSTEGRYSRLLDGGSLHKSP